MESAEEMILEADELATEEVVLDDGSETGENERERRALMTETTRPKRVSLEAHEAKALKIRRGIRAAQLRVVADKELGRVTPDAVVRLSKLRLPELPVTVVKKQPLVDGHLKERRLD